MLSDTTVDYPLGEDVFSMMGEVCAKTISSDFDEQVDAYEKLYGCNLKFDFTKQDVRAILDDGCGYNTDVRKRVEKIVYSQMNKYAYLF